MLADAKNMLQNGKNPELLSNSTYLLKTELTEFKQGDRSADDFDMFMAYLQKQGVKLVKKNPPNNLTYTIDYAKVEAKNMELNGSSNRSMLIVPIIVKNNTTNTTETIELQLENFS